MNTYTVNESDIGFTGGRYKSKSPASAAKKAATRMFKTTNKKHIIFTLRQTTQGTNKKLYKYRAEKVKLDKPVILNIKGVEIIYNHKINIKPLSISENKMSGGGDSNQDLEYSNGGNCNENFCSI